MVFFYKIRNFKKQSNKQAIYFSVVFISKILWHMSENEKKCLKSFFSQRFISQKHIKS